MSLFNVNDRVKIKNFPTTLVIASLTGTGFANVNTVGGDFFGCLALKNLERA